MPFEELAFGLVIGVSALAGLSGLGVVVGSALYDVRLARAGKKPKRAKSRAKRSKTAPVIGVVVVAGSSSEQALASLQSALEASYAHKQVVLYADPQTSRRVRSVLGRPKIKTRYETATTDAGLARLIRSDYTLYIQAGDVLAKDALKQLNTQLQSSEHAVQMRVCSLSGRSLTRLLQQYDTSLIHIYRKARAGFGGIPYAADSIIYTNKLPRAHVSLLVLPVLAVGYLLYLALVLKTPVYFLLSWLIYSCWLLFCGLIDDHHSLRQKFGMLFYAPVVYNLFMIRSTYHILSSTVAALWQLPLGAYRLLRSVK